MATQTQAEAFQPTRWTWLSGVRRSVHVPRSPAALHTTTGFWANLSLHLFGVTPFAGRFFPFLFALSAIPIVAWATWLVTRSSVAACLAGLFMALSPHGAAYGAQARGYAEAMALAPLLLVLIEYYRRKPDRIIRAVLVFVCAVNLSLTVYTTWVFWVLPVLMVAAWQIPRRVDESKNRNAARLGLVLVVVAATAFMTVYTIDRWKLLTFSAGQFGDQFGNWTQSASWMKAFAGELTALPAVVLPLAVLGAARLRRTPTHGWLWMIGAAVLAPFLWTLFRGSPGYTRNLGYLVGPVAILVGAGADHAIRRLVNRGRPVPAIASIVLLLGGTTALGLTKLDDRARSILLPDWSAATRDITSEPEAAGPRWIAPCLAHHWQINWYRQPTDAASFFAVPDRGQIEVVIGATLDRQGHPKVFRKRASGPGSEEIDLPVYLHDTPPSARRARVEWRRWTGRAIAPSEASLINEEATLFAFVRFHNPPRSHQWETFLENADATNTGVVTFKATPNGSGEFRSMILPARALARVRHSAKSTLGLSPEDLRIFALSPMSP